MSKSNQIIVREFGMALAVLAVWLLTLLAPMHLASRYTAELAAAGIIAPPNWSLCIPAEQTEDGATLPSLCPAKSLGQDQLWPGPDTRALPLFVATARTVTWHVVEVRDPTRNPTDIGQPRAPPLQA